MTGCIVVAGTHSGVGKTSVSLGLMAALRRRGLTVQPFKVGPDYLDPLWHRLAAERTSYNLDTWMTGSEYVQRLFADKSADADVAIIEGVMGLFDGASPTGLSGSTAEVAALLEVPILLVASAHGASRSFAATIKGFSDLEPQCRIAAAIGNHCGSARHAAMLREALAAARLCQLAGWIGKDSLPPLPSRHLGLRTPGDKREAEKTIAALADAIAETIDLDAIVNLADSSSNSSHRSLAQLRSAAAGVEPEATNRPTLAVATDEAFQFYYPDDLELLQSLGVNLVSFSPLSDDYLPEGIDGIYLGGGYPEEAAAQLSQNAAMRAAISRFAQAGKAIYAECGGMMYLAQSLCDRDGRWWPMVGLLPFATRMLDRRNRLGYVETLLIGESLLGPPGTKLRGHEFHYSEIIEPVALEGWRQPYELRGARGSDPRPAGFARGNLLASYVHQHLASNRQAAAAFARALHDLCDRRCRTTAV